MTETQVAKADELIAAGEPLSRIRKLFTDKGAELLYYARFQASKYELPVPPQCCMCSSNADVIGRYDWRAIFSTRFSPAVFDLLLLFLGILCIRFKSKVITFGTAHWFCKSCWRKMFFRRVLANVIHFFALLAAVIALFLTLALWAAVLYFMRDPTWKKDLPSMILSAVGSTLAVAICAAILLSLYRLRVPSALRPIPRRPFAYLGVQKETAFRGFPVEVSGA